MTDQWPEPNEPFSLDHLKAAYETIRDQPFQLSRGEARRAEILRLEADWLASDDLKDQP